MKHRIVFVPKFTYYLNGFSPSIFNFGMLHYFLVDALDSLVTHEYLALPKIVGAKNVFCLKFIYRDPN